MIYRVRLPFTAPPLTANEVRQEHWSRQAAVKLEVAQAVVAVVKAAGIPQLDRVAVTLVWYAPDYGTRDCDGMYPMLKAVIDSLTPAKPAVPKGTLTKAGTPRKKAQAAKLGAGIIPDDRAQFVGRTSTEIVLDDPDPRIELLIEVLPPLPPRRKRPRAVKAGPAPVPVVNLGPSSPAGAGWRARVDAARAASATRTATHDTH